MEPNPRRLPLRTPSLHLALYAALLAATAAHADFQRFAWTDSAGVRHILDLPSSLEPDPGDSLVYLDAAMQLDTMDHQAFMAMDTAGRTGMKYGRLLGLSLTRASKDYQASLPDLKAKAAGDTLFQVSMMEGYRARRKRLVWAGIGGGTGLIVGGALLQFGLPRKECTSRNGGPFECETTEAIPALMGAGLATMAVGAVLGGAFFVMEFDEEKVARRLAGKP